MPAASVLVLIGLLLCVVAACIVLALVIYQSEFSNHPSDQTGSNVRRPEFFRSLLIDPIAFFTMMLFVCTVVQLVIAIIQVNYLDKSDETSREAAYAAKRSADLAQAALIATQRPWLSVNARLGPKGVYRTEIGNLALNITYLLKNSGLSPALFANLAPHLMTNDPLPGRAARLARACAKVEPATDESFGYTIFPGESAEIEVSHILTKEQMGQTTDASNHVLPGVAVFGCVIYRDDIKSSARHESRFYYSIRNSAKIKDSNYIDITRVHDPDYPMEFGKWVEAGSFFAN